MNVLQAVKNAYAQLIGEGYHRPNETIEELEYALLGLGMDEEQIDALYNEARQGS